MNFRTKSHKIRFAAVAAAVFIFSAVQIVMWMQNDREPTMKSVHTHSQSTAATTIRLENFSRKYFIDIFIMCFVFDARSQELWRRNRLSRQHIIIFWCDESINVILIIHRWLLARIFHNRMYQRRAIRQVHNATMQRQASRHRRQR